MFGSHAWGSPTPDSDIDLMVIVSESDRSPYQRAILGHRCLSGLGIAKDIVVQTRAEFDFWQEARASLEYKVAHQRKVLYLGWSAATEMGAAPSKISVRPGL